MSYLEWRGEDLALVSDKPKVWDIKLVPKRKPIGFSYDSDNHASYVFNKGGWHLHPGKHGYNLCNKCLVMAVF